MAKVPFDIKFRPQIESGEYKVETRDGSPARVVCWDANSCSPIIFLVTEHDDLDDKDKEYAYYCNNFGSAFSIESPKDLFLVTPVPELTVFEQSVRDCIIENLTTHGREMSSAVFIDDETTKKLAAELLDLARKEFVKQGYVIETKLFHDAVEKIDDKHKAEMSVKYSLHCKIENGTRHAIMNWNEFQKVAQHFIDCGKAEALKNLPRWKKATGKERFNERMIVLAGDNELLCTNYAEEGEYYISFSELEKLPKED